MRKKEAPCKMKNKRLVTKLLRWQRKVIYYNVNSIENEKN